MELEEKRLQEMKTKQLMDTKRLKVVKKEDNVYL